MANLKKIKNKIKSVQNLKKITRALEIVSTVKLQKNKEKAENLKKYLVDLLFILNTVSQKVDLFENELKQSNINQINKKLVILISTDRGLCGSLNSKLTRQIFSEYKNNISETDFFIIGKKGLDFISRAGFNISGFLNSKDDISDEDMNILYIFLEKAFDENTYSNIKIYFNYFKNSLFQIPTNIQIFPLIKDNFNNFLESNGIQYQFKDNIKNKDLIIEPDLESFIKEVKRQIRYYLISSAIIQNKTGEHASRMIAMKNAKDNSIKLIDNLVLGFNKIRQASITQEISEIVSAKIAIEN